jgi:uncharacterized protein YbjT (DUF2867 family)
MSFVIHGATGAQGAPLFDLMLARGLDARAALRDVEKAGGRPAISADAGSASSLEAAYRGSEGIFVHLPQVPEPLRIDYAKNIVTAIDRARPARVVFSTSGAIVDEPSSPLQAADDSAVGILMNGLRESGVSHAVIAPRLYLENLMLPAVIEPAKASGLLQYPIRADLAVSWSSHHDIADVALRLLTDHTVSAIVGVGHLPGLTGPQLAAAFATHLGRAVTFETKPVADFQAELEPFIGPAASAIAAFYQALAERKDNVIAEHTSAQTLLGLTPRSVEDWLKA